MLRHVAMIIREEMQEVSSTTSNDAGKQAGLVELSELYGKMLDRISTRGAQTLFGTELASK